MPTLPKIMSEMTIATNMKQIMGTMKGIAMSSFVEFKKMRDKRYDRFTRSFDNFFHLADMSKDTHPFIKNSSPVVGVIAITSNESFMAGLNNKIIKKATDKVQGQKAHFVLTGPRMKGRMISENRPFTVFPGVKEKNVLEVAMQIKDFVIEKVVKEELGKIIAVFADPVSMSTQEIRAITILPAHDIYPEEMRADDDPDEMLCQESKIDSVMTVLTGFWLTHKLVEMFQDNKMSEYAAQAMQLDGSLQNLAELERKMKLTFVKTRREIIDSSLRETISALLVTGGGL
jgi:ATP synthase F1 gamma subunit